MKIVITENEDFNPEVTTQLSTFGTVATFNTGTRNELLQNAKGANVLFVRLRFKIDKEVIDQNPNLQYILTATTGLDHIDVAYFQSKGGKVISLKGEVQFLNSIPSTAEHTWGLLLGLIKKSFTAYQDVKSGNWRRDLFKGNNLSSKKIGILGLGRVGSQVANYANAFNMQVGYFDIEDKVSPYQKFNSMEDLFKWAQIISIHIPLNKDTHHLINNKTLEYISSDTLIINTSRGAIVQEADLLHKIKNLELKGYATDVLEDEIENTIQNNALVIGMKEGYNIIITPHIAGATYESMHITENFIFEKFKNTIN